MWTVPSQPNGIIRSYQISYFSTINVSDITAVNTENVALEFEVSGLRPFTHYILMVAGFTVALGEYSNELRVVTQESSKYILL